MAEIEPAFVSYLTAYPGMTALIGDRMYPTNIPEGATLPLVTYQRISTPRLRSHNGPSGLAHPRFQFNCWGRSYDEASRVAQQLVFGIEGFRGLMAGVEVQAGFVEDERDDYDTVTRQYRRMVDAILWHRETTA